MTKYFDAKMTAAIYQVCLQAVQPWQTKKLCFLCPFVTTCEKLLNFQLGQL